MKLIPLLLACATVLPVGAKSTKITVDPSVTYQTIDNFGASDAWRQDYMGRYWPKEKLERMADLLFSTQTDAQGNPKGMGLSCWRVNVGAGSQENRLAPGEVKAETNRTECFLAPDGTWDFSKQQGQQWFMEAARKRGLNNFLFFTNSAPYFMTRNAATVPPDNRGINLRNDQYARFADFLATVAAHFTGLGYNVAYISPVNEPQVPWADNPYQEGSVATPEQCYRVVTALDSVIGARKVPTRVLFGESGLKYFFPRPGAQDKDDASAAPYDMIADFFTPGGRHSLLDMEHTEPVITGHDYWSTYPADTVSAMRRRIGAALQGGPARFWASEYCIIEKNPETQDLPEETRDMDLALYIARIIHHDLASANASAWQWWTVTSPGHEVPLRLEPVDTTCNQRSLLFDGRVIDTKRLWATANYSFFIRPGYRRVEAALPQGSPLMVSAFLSPDGERLVTVAVNDTREEQQIDLSVPRAALTRRYVTSNSLDCAYLGEQKSGDFTLEPRSVTTFVTEIKK